MATPIDADLLPQYSYPTDRETNNTEQDEMATYKVSTKVWEYAHALDNIGKLARNKHFAIVAAKKK